MLIISCKRETQNNVNIIYTSINKTLTIGTINELYDLDINKDGLNDIEFLTRTNYDSPSLSYIDEIFRIFIK